MREDEEYPAYKDPVSPGEFAIFGDRTNTPMEDTIVKKIRAYALTKDLEGGAAIALLYLTGSRIEEICDYTYTGLAKEDIDLKKIGVTPGNITIEEKEVEGVNERWLKITTRVLKKFSPEKGGMELEDRRDQLEKNHTKTMPLLIDEDHPLYPLIEVVLMRVEQITGPTDDTNAFNINSRKFKTERLYTKTSSNLKKRVKKYLSTHPHLFRHWRCRHLVENYGCSTSDLVKLISWNRPDMALTYTESSQAALEAKDRKRVKERKEAKAKENIYI